MSALGNLKMRMKPGQVYRRADLARWSHSVDRHLKQLVDEGTLKKVSPGVYSYPRNASFGRVPPEDKKLVQAFLKSDDFLLFSPNEYNVLGLGTTQLYNTQFVYNRKRHGRFELSGRMFEFKMKPYFPKQVTREFLLVDLLNNANQLAEEKERVLARAKILASEMDKRALYRAVDDCGNIATKKFFAFLNEGAMNVA